MLDISHALMAKKRGTSYHLHMAPSGKNAARTRILILEEHPLLRHGLCDYLNAQPDMICCGESDSIRDARDKIAESKPQLLLTALRLGAGDAGYVMKSAPAEELLAAIREILKGEIYVSRDVAMRAFKKTLESRPDQSGVQSGVSIESLSDREMHVFHLLGSGLRNKQIAQSLNLSVKTVETHRENIKHKLRLACSRDLVERATKHVEETFLPQAKSALGGKHKKKVLRFPDVKGGGGGPLLIGQLS